MKAYGLPVQSCAWKPVTANAQIFNGKDAAASVVSTKRGHGPTGASGRPVVTVAAAASSSSASSSSPREKQVVPSQRQPPQPPASTAGSGPPRAASPDLEACHLSSKQLEDLMEDDCGGPVSNGDPMLSSPHLSSPASSSHYSDVLSPADSMDLAA